GDADRDIAEMPAALNADTMALGSKSGGLNTFGSSSPSPPSLSVKVFTVKWRKPQVSSACHRSCRADGSAPQGAGSDPERHETDVNDAAAGAVSRKDLRFKGTFLSSSSRPQHDGRASRYRKVREAIEHNPELGIMPRKVN